MTGAPLDDGAPHWRRWLAPALGLLLLLWLGVLLTRLNDGLDLPLEDFLGYWAAGRQLVRGENPYDAAALLRWQHEAGREDLTWPVQVFNPPWALPLLAPFGALPPRSAHLLWLLAGLLAAMCSADRLWLLYGGLPERRFWAWGLALTFAPTLIAFRLGQVSAWVLLSLVGFLCLVKREAFFWAGAVLALATIKPHLVYLVGLAVLVWSVSQRRWSLLAGSAAGLLAGTSLALFWNPAVLEQYLEFMRQAPAAVVLTPTLGGWLRRAVGFQHFWVQFLPTLAGIAWLLVYWRQRRHDWVWSEELPLVLLVSCLTTFYGAFPFDLIVLLIPVLQLAAWLERAGSDQQRGAALAGFLALTAVALSIRAMEYQVWITPVVLIAYLYFARPRNACTPSIRQTDAAPLQTPP
jgi:hypothetical protein